MEAGLAGLFDTISAIDAALTSQDVLARFRAELNKFGLDNSLITGLPVPHDSIWHRAVVYDGWSPEWFERYDAQGHFVHDPCAAHSRLSDRPFFWHQLPEGRMRGRARQVMNEATEFGMRDGLCVPIHIPLAGPAVVTAAGEHVEVPPAALPFIETVCVHTFRKLGGLETAVGDEDRPPLTPRERELLQWAGQGKSGEDVSCILGITLNTVESHHRNIRNKLDVSNILHAVVKAIRRGEIQI
ncbi:LuxR family transcriptional regulator [Mesorhizobium sp. CAU 1741]|uniref:LuxR family transcriptional regulator n=1 Tax=Mesorhizobium sp. CAU 1741 TaxID=3140366 RepID=UPI00325AB3C8